MTTIETAADFVFQNHGSIWLCTPTSDCAREHLEENVGSEAMWYSGSLVVEPRYVQDFAVALDDEGWTVEL